MENLDWILASYAFLSVFIALNHHTWSKKYTHIQDLVSFWTSETFWSLKIMEGTGQ